MPRSRAATNREAGQIGSVTAGAGHTRGGRAMIRQSVLLFYENFEQDRFVAGDRHLQRWLRKGHHLFKRGHKTSGFRVAFELLKLGLERAGCSVRVNDYAYARQHPDHPVSISRYPHILRTWSLPNPAILGPGLFDPPEQAPELMSDRRFHWYVVQCGWMNELFAQCSGISASAGLRGLIRTARPMHRLFEESGPHRLRRESGTSRKSVAL